MSLKHAILVLLENKPGSGYDLVQRFKSGIGHFWNATHQQVYQELKKLQKARLVEFRVEAQTERPDRKVYRITRGGHRALEEWFRKPIPPPRLKDALLIKIYAGRLVGTAALVAELEQHLAQNRRKLEAYGELEQAFFAQDEATRRRYRLPYLTLRRGIRYLQGTIEWMEEAHALLGSDKLLPARPLLPASSPARAAKR
jgi:PadR family transcriptional regulator AphA